MARFALSRAISCPPFDSGLDSVPQLDKELRVSVKDCGLSMVPVGAVSVRSTIEKQQPLLGLHGHIHESRGLARLEERFARTLEVNTPKAYSKRGYSILKRIELSGISQHQARQLQPRLWFA